MDPGRGEAVLTVRPSIGSSRPRLVPLVAVCTGLVLVTGVSASWWLGSQLSAPARRPAPVPPADLPVEQVEVASSSGSILPGWLLRGEPGRGAVVLLHGLRGSRADMIPRARFLWAAGFSVLMFDFQAHGESPGKRITFGHLESRDVRAAVVFLRALLPGERIGAHGISLGGAAMLIGESPLAVDAAVLEAVYSTFEEAVENRIRIRLGGVAPMLAPLLVLQARPRLGVWPSALRPIEGAPRLRAPALIVVGAADRHATPTQVRRLFDAAPEPKELLVVEGAAHEDLYRAGGTAYRERVLGFLARYVAGSRTR